MFYPSFLLNIFNIKESILIKEQEFCPGNICKSFFLTLDLRENPQTALVVMYHESCMIDTSFCNIYAVVLKVSRFSLIDSGENEIQGFMKGFEQFYWLLRQRPFQPFAIHLALYPNVGHFVSHHQHKI